MSEQLNPGAPFKVDSRAERKLSPDGRPVQIFITLKEDKKTIVMEPHLFHDEGALSGTPYDAGGRMTFQRLMPQFGAVVVKVVSTGQEFPFDTYDAFIAALERD